MWFLYINEITEKVLKIVHRYLFCQFFGKYLNLIFCTHYLLKTTSCLRINLVLSKVNLVLTLSRRRSLSYRNQSIDLKGKSMNWFLYDRDFRHKSVNQLLSMTHDIYHYLDGDYEVRGVFSDISKAFDKVGHKCLVFELEQMDPYYKC